MRLVRGSEINDFLRCRLRWQYAWLDGIKAKRPDGKLFFGTMAHKFLESYYNRLSCQEDCRPHCVEQAPVVALHAMQDLFDETDTSLMEQYELDELWGMASAVTANYVAQWREQDLKMKVIATELTFAIPLDDNIAYTGTIDLIWKDEDDKLWFADHKFVASIQDYADNTPMDRQISRYWWSLQQLAKGNGYLLTEEGWSPVADDLFYTKELTEPHGFIYNLVLKDVPRKPELLKKGGLSVAKNQKTTYGVYVQALREHGLLPDEAIVNDLDRPQSPILVTEYVPEQYREILQHLANQESEEGNRFFRRVPVTRLQPEIDAAIEEFHHQAKEAGIIRKYGKVRKARTIYRNITHDCSWDCQYKALCHADMANENVDMVRNLAYTNREEDQYASSTIETN